jgi:predicted AAA+ superfamily ATPase
MGRNKNKMASKMDKKYFPFTIFFKFCFRSKTNGENLRNKTFDSRASKKFEREAIFYFDVTLLADIESLRRVIDKYLEIKKIEKIENSFIFLDEVTSLENWWRVVKAYIDMGIFQNDVITITGSSSLKLKGQVELFPGRRGKCRDITVLPLSFREFLEVCGIKVCNTGNIEKDMKKIWKEEDIKKLFKLYLETGGYPTSINKDPDSEIQLISAIENEILRANKSLELMKGVISSILIKAPSPLSFSTIGNDIGVSYKTVQEYTEVAKRFCLFQRKKCKMEKRKEVFLLGRISC